MNDIDQETNTQHKTDFFAKTAVRFMKSHYPIILGLAVLVFALINYFLRPAPIEYSGYMLLAAFMFFSVFGDIRYESSPRSFLLTTLPFLVFVGVILLNGNELWHSVLRWELKKKVVIDCNSFFDHIPFNDGSFARLFQPHWLTVYMKAVYNTGFVLALLLPLIRSLVCLDFKKMLRYSLCAHIFQVLLITPFYMVFYLQEVWYVRGNPDMLERHMNHALAVETTLNCFPSMHTSIAFAMLLLVLRENNKLFKGIWSFYCISIIYSTLYLEIHWVIDVLGGLLLGYLTVKLVDCVMARSEAFLLSHIRKPLAEESVEIK